MVQATRLKLAFDFGRQAVLSAEHHACNETLNVAIAFKRHFEPPPYPLLDAIRPVPASFNNGDEAWISDRSRPVDPLTLEVPAEIEDTGVSIDRWPAQLHDDLQTVART